MNQFEPAIRILRESRGLMSATEEEATKEEIKQAIRVLEAAGGWTPSADKKFINHIQDHLKPGQEVICKICGKTAKEIVGDFLPEPEEERK